MHMGTKSFSQKFFCELRQSHWSWPENAVGKSKHDFPCLRHNSLYRCWQLPRLLRERIGRCFIRNDTHETRMIVWIASTLLDYHGLVRRTNAS